MIKVVSFLRGVNMTGHNSIKMADLTTLFIKLGFKDAKTYIQSGNVIFTATNDLTTKEIALSIEESITKKFGYKVSAILRTEIDLKTIVALNPFISEIDFDHSKMAVIFLTEIPTLDQMSRIAEVDYPPDKFKIIGKEIYIYCPNGFGRTKLYTNFFENKMKVTGTARNWKTINAVLEIAETNHL
jgi:uncharacterized protein (DUF1697 family)